MNRSAAPPCPICEQELSESQSIEVCASCHHSLLTTGAVAMSTTGEFRIPAAVLAFEVGNMESQAPARRSECCTWCQKHGQQVKKLLTAGELLICNECISLCVDILTAELGDGWRS